MMRLMVISGLLVLCSLLSGLGTGGQPPSTAPEIIYLGFPKEINADGTPVSGVIAFKDIDGDIIRAEFAVVQATDFQPFSLDPKVKGIKKGEFPFQIATKTAQRVTLQATLLDEAGHRSAPWEFSFTAISPAILQVSPTNLNFSSEVGQNPPSQTIQITNAGTGTLSWSANADQPWITLSPTRGTAPSSITVSINVTNLSAGNYSGQIIIIASGAQNSPASVVVKLSIEARPTLEVQPRQLIFELQEGRSLTLSHSLEIRNSGGGILTWIATASVPWLVLNTQQGSLPAGTATVLTVTANAGEFIGNYQGQIILSATGAANSPTIIPVTLLLDGFIEVTGSCEGTVTNFSSSAEVKVSGTIQPELIRYTQWIIFQHTTQDYYKTYFIGHSGSVETLELGGITV